MLEVPIVHKGHRQLIQRCVLVQIFDQRFLTGALKLFGQARVLRVELKLRNWNPGGAQLAVNHDLLLPSREIRDALDCSATSATDAQ